MDVNTAFKVGSRPRPHDLTNHVSSVKAGRHAFVITTKTSPARRRDKAGLDSFPRTGNSHGQEHLKTSCTTVQGDLESNAVQTTLDNGGLSTDLAVLPAEACMQIQTCPGILSRRGVLHTQLSASTPYRVSYRLPGIYVFALASHGELRIKHVLATG